MDTTQSAPKVPETTTMPAQTLDRIAPGPKGHWLLGSLPERRNDPLRLFLNSALQYGDIVRFRMGPKFSSVTVHLLSEPGHIKHVLQDNHKNYIKGFGYDKLKPLLGRGLLTSEGEHWRQNRKLAQPAFHRQRLNGLAATMVDATQTMLERWKAQGDKPLDVAKEMMRLALGIVSRSLFSIDVSKEADVVGNALTLLIGEANRRILSVTDLNEILPSPRRARFQKAVATLNEVVYRIIAERRKSGRDHGDLLSMLMDARDEDTGEGMNDEQLRDEVMTLFLAGHETTASVLAWAWYLLSKNPAVERALVTEITEVLGEKTATFEDLPRLRYTMMVIEESMRLYPPAWVFSRQALENDNIGGFQIPKNSVIVMSPYVMHRHPKYWENPEGFDPERFAPKAAEARPKYVYFPFSGGPRQCIGNNFALMEAQLVLVTVLQQFRLHLVPGRTVVPEPLITMRPKHGVWMTLGRRNLSH